MALWPNCGSYETEKHMRIAFLVLPNMLVTSFTNAFELMFAARVKAVTEHHPLAKSISLDKVAIKTERISLSSGLSVQPEHVIGTSTYDMVFIPALWRNPRPLVKANPDVVEWIRTQWESGAVINATGTGVCLVAEAGLLDNQAATTHWHHFDQFEKDYPAVNLKRQHFITSAGKLFCAASINAQTDLVLHHVHRFISRDVSEHLSQHFSHEVRQPYDRLSFDQEKDNAHPDELILQAQLWLQNNLSKSSIKISDVALMLGTSHRNFSRRFRMATGVSPLQYLQEQRVQEAKDLLKQSNLSISEVAFRVGYLDVSYFTKQFGSRSGMSPSNWRNTVRAKLFD